MDVGKNDTRGAPDRRSREGDSAKPTGFSGFRSRGGWRKPKVCPFAENKNSINYLDTRLLKGFLTERGKIVSRRVSFVSAKRQRELAVAIKRARFLALLPYIID